MIAESFSENQTKPATLTAELNERLIVFARYPHPGTTKTRLIPLLGKAGAAELQRRMTEYTMAVAASASDGRPRSVEVRYEGGSASLMRRWLGAGLPYRAQQGKDIGARMQDSLKQALDGGADRAVIIGTDIPEINESILNRAFEALRKHDLVLGPAADGGYYLIGVNRRCSGKALSHLFCEISWSTDRVLAQTLARAQLERIAYHLLETLHDVDRPGDLYVWGRCPGSRRHRSLPISISIIIPTLNETACLAHTLSAVGDRPGVEIIVVDGGSTDDTRRLAASEEAVVLLAAPPKARQMNAGAAVAQGDILLFLHADTRLPNAFEKTVRICLREPHVALGAFRLQIDHASGWLQVIESAANWRSQFLKMPYGDQALFLTKSVFQDLGGYSDMPIMEDFDLVRRCQKYGRIAIAPDAVITSARRWQHLGITRTWLINQAIVFGYMVGISPRRLAAWYRHKPDPGRRR